MTRQEKLKGVASERFESWLNGNREQLDKWIGNSATRLLAVISVAAGEYGSNEVRMFLDSLRNRRGF